MTAGKKTKSPELNPSGYDVFAQNVRKFRRVSQPFLTCDASPADGRTDRPTCRRPAIALNSLNQATGRCLQPPRQSFCPLNYTPSPPPGLKLGSYKITFSISPILYILSYTQVNIRIEAKLGPPFHIYLLILSYRHHFNILRRSLQP